MIKRIFYVIMIAIVMVACGDEPSKGSEEKPGEGGTEENPKFQAVKVLEYNPAPGQFVNELPEYEVGNTNADMLHKVELSLNNNTLITLGSLGGSITMKLVKPIKNAIGKYDFRIVGNSFYGVGSTDENKKGSAEPGIIYVMQDVNGNGKADDSWYEIRGSVSFDKTSITQITYLRPTMEEVGTITDGYITNPQYIKWNTTSPSETGFLMKITEHEQSYYPAWLTNKENSITMNNVRRLPNNGFYNADIGQYQLSCFDYGYADNHPNNVDGSKIKIDWAVDANGNSVTLSQIDFIKVVSSLLQFNGLLGESSTEIAGVESFN
ncbi:MAG: PKD domain-containing protein [Muribaculaceae bacterium]